MVEPAQFMHIISLAELATYAGEGRTLDEVIGLVRADHALAQTYTQSYQTGTYRYFVVALDANGEPQDNPKLAEEQKEKE